jgi:hypothetical protein
MSANLLPACPLHLAPETLSAWRDNALEAREARRISSHVDTCTACQAQLHQFEQIATVLRSERVPLPAQPLWPGLRGRLDRLDTPIAPLPHHQRRPAVAGIGGGLAVLAAVLIVAIVHFSVAPLPSRGAIQAGPTPTSGPVPTVAPAQQLTWKTLAEPAIFTQAGIIAFPPAFAPGDASTVYACLWNYSDSSAAPEIWATHDAGNSWSIVGQLPAHPSGPCGVLAVDATQSQALVATVGQSMSPDGTATGPTNYPAFLSTNGGKTWTSIGTGRSYMQLATYKGLTYALVDDFSPGNSPYSSHLAVSSDLRSWQNIDQPILLGGASVHEGVKQFWLNPTNGSLLAVTSPGGDQGQGAERLWVSNDGGHAWKEITPTAFPPQAVAVQPPAAGRPWHVCGVMQQSIDSPVGEVTGNNLIACTTDGGRTWVPRPALNLPWSHSGTNGVHSLVIITIGADGALIAAINQKRAPLDVDRFNLYRLLSSSSTWESIGSAPNSNGTSSNGTGDGPMQNGFQVYPSGGIVYVAGQFYIATYP